MRKPARYSSTISTALPSRPGDVTEGERKTRAVYETARVFCFANTKAPTLSQAGLTIGLSELLRDGVTISLVRG